MNQSQMTSWIPLLVGLVVTIVAETIILTVALWIMIKFQKLNYHFLGLLGAAALTSALDEILGRVLGHFLGIYLASYVSTPIVVAVLFLCIKKLTEADPVDVSFTIGVGYAVYFCLNLWLLAALMGELRPGYAGEDRDIPSPEAVSRPEQLPPKTNRPVTPSPMTNKLAGKVAPPAPAPEKAATAVNSNGPVPATPVTKIPKGFSLKGLISGSKPSAMINTGVRTYTLFEGDTLTMETANGRVDVRCEKLEADRAILDIGGEPLILLLPAAKR
jgi:hypothetical protein